MTILKNFDFDELRRQRARANTKPVDLVAGLNEISGDIAKLKVGETAQLEIPDYQNTSESGSPVQLRKFVMNITAKLNNLTPLDGQWEGRQFKVGSDGQRYVYVHRGPDLKGKDIPTRKRGGRTAASTAPVEGATVTEHA